MQSVALQGFATTFIENEPEVRNYNSGIIEKDGARYIATRRFCRDMHRCEIVINKLDGGAKVERVCQLRLPRAHGMENFEDARLFWHNDKVHIAYTEGRYWSRPWVAVQKLAILRDDWSVERVIVIGFGENSIGQEKNWQFFTYVDTLYFVYSIAPHIVVRLNRDYQVSQVFATDRTLFMPLRGGTPPVRVGERYISFPHFHREIPLRARRYGFCAYAFFAFPPFEIIGVTRPLIMASEDDRVLQNPSAPHWLPLVVFPCGALLHDGEWTVSAGINDSYDALFTIPNSRLQFQ